MKSDASAKPAKHPQKSDASAKPAEYFEHFNFERALALAGKAFYAYANPNYAKADYVPAPGASIWFADRGFVRETFDYVLEIRLVRAANLRPVDLLTTSNLRPGPLDVDIRPDPFAVVSAHWSSLKAYSPARRMGPTIANNTNPVWGPDTPLIRIPIRDLKHDKVHVQLYDEDRKVQSERLGSVDLDLTSLVPGGPATEVTRKLDGAPGLVWGSSVTVSCRLRRLAEADLGTLVFEDKSGADINAAETAAAAVIAAAGASTTDGPVAGEGQVNAVIETGHNHESWEGLAKEMGGEAAEPLSPIAFVENSRTDTQLWLFRDTERKQLVLAFRGSESKRDWLTNLSLLTTWLPTWLGGLPGTQVKVHGGFLEAYDSIRAASNGLVKLVTGGSGHTGASLAGGQNPATSWRLLVTGHSLGGGLATLAAYDLAVQRKFERLTGRSTDVSVEMYTFAAPRVGNDKFVEGFNKLLMPNAWRVVNVYDPVASVPRTLSYGPVGKVVQLGPKAGILPADRAECSFEEKMASLNFKMKNCLDEHISHYLDRFAVEVDKRREDHGKAGSRVSAVASSVRYTGCAASAAVGQKAALARACIRPGHVGRAGAVLRLRVL